MFLNPPKKWVLKQTLSLRKREPFVFPKSILFPKCILGKERKILLALPKYTLGTASKSSSSPTPNRVDLGRNVFAGRKEMEQNV
jgi:hypothetical protein